MVIEQASSRPLQVYCRHQRPHQPPFAEPHSLSVDPPDLDISIALHKGKRSTTVKVQNVDFELRMFMKMVKKLRVLL